MTMREWEKRLGKGLRTLSKKERRTVLDYYREMYGDMLDAGVSEEKITEEFGAPEACAEKILSEEGEELLKKRERTVREKPSAASVAGLIFVSLLLVLPVYCCILAGIAVLASGVIAGGACAIAGGAYALISPVYFGVNGVAFFGVIAHVGVGLVASGVGVPLAIGFGWLTKYASIGAVKLFKLIYFGRKSK